jgi:glycosyltransferase involved in cell wall biosynthesis
MSADTIAIVLQTPRDQHSSVFLTYQALASELMRQGRHVAIVTPHDLPVSRRAAGRWTPLVYPVAVARWVSRHARECDVIVFHSYAGWLGASAAASRGVPAVVAFHGLEPLYHRQLVQESGGSGSLSWRYRLLQERLMPMFLRRGCRHAARVTCLNTAERDFLVRSKWVRPERVAVVAHGVSDEFFVRERPPRPVRTVLFVGQWLPLKGVSYLVQAFEALARTHLDLRLICAGTLSTAERVTADFPEADAIRSRITVLPRVDRQALIALYRDADVFVFPSIYEGFGLALVEAMAARLPIVTTAVGVAGDALKDGQSALMIPTRDAGAIVSAVDRLVRDDELRGKLGAAAYTVAQGYREVDAVRSWAHTLTSIDRLS